MRRTRILSMSAATLVLGICAAYAVTRTLQRGGAGRSPPIAGPSTAPAPATLRSGGGDEVSGLRQELARLRAEFAELRQQQVRVEGPPSPGAQVAREVLTDPTARAEEEARRLVQMAETEDAFRAEPADARWSADTASALHEALEGNRISRASVRSVECRTRTCRVELADDGSSDLAKALPLFALQVGQKLPSVTTDQVDEGNGARTILYMSASP